MADFSSSKDVKVTFSEEETEILKKASKILKDLGHEMWMDDCDDESFFFSDLGDGIERAINGDW